MRAACPAQLLDLIKGITIILTPSFMKGMCSLKGTR